jgi:hypothetical protein
MVSISSPLSNPKSGAGIVGKPWISEALPQTPFCSVATNAESMLPLLPGPATLLFPVALQSPAELHEIARASLLVINEDGPGIGTTLPQTPFVSLNAKADHKPFPEEGMLLATAPQLPGELHEIEPVMTVLGTVWPGILRVLPHFPFTSVTPKSAFSSFPPDG